MQLCFDKDLISVFLTDTPFVLVFLSEQKSLRSIIEFRQIFARFLQYHPFLLHFMILTVIKIYFNVGGGVRPVLSGLLIIYLFRVGAFYLRAIFEILFQIVKTTSI